MDTQDAIIPIQLGLLYLLIISPIVSLDGSFPFFSKCIPTKIGLFVCSIILEAMSISFPLDTTSR